MLKLEADKAMIWDLTKPRLLLVLDHVDQRFWPPHPTRQVKSELVAAIWSAIRAGRYSFQLQHSL